MCRIGRTFTLVLIVLSLQLCGCAGVGVTRYYDHAVVVSAAPVATDIGVEVLRSGGNAFDAAVAVGFALAVVYPEAGNIGGGGFAVIRDGQSGVVRALDFRETAPAAAFETMYLDDSSEVIEGASTVGALAAGVPGTVAGLYELWKEYGSLPWDQLVTPIAKLADTGFVVDKYLWQSITEKAAALSGFEVTARQFLPGGKAPAVGDRLVQADLARTLYAVACSV